MLQLRPSSQKGQQSSPELPSAPGSSGLHFLLNELCGPCCLKLFLLLHSALHPQLLLWALIQHRKRAMISQWSAALGDLGEGGETHS